MPLDLQQLIDKVPKELQPVAIKYGPVVIQWTSEEIWAWISLLTTDQDAAYRLLLQGLPDTGPSLVAQWDIAVSDRASINIKHSGRKAIAGEAVSAVLQAMLIILAPLVGL